MARDPRQRRRDRRKDRHDRRKRRREERGPGPEAIQGALDHLLSHDIPGTPKVGAIGVLRDSTSFPIETGDRKIVDARIQSGDPQHGALRSDDHLSRYEVEFPKECGECGHHRAVYTYSAYHHIAGSESITCLRCEHQHHSEEWG